MQSDEGTKGIALFHSGKFLNNRGKFPKGTTQGNKSLEGLTIGQVLGRVSQLGRGIDYTLARCAQA